MNSKYDFLIVGAGFYGATFAREATDAGYRCLVIDKRSHIAGNAYTYYDPETNIDVHWYGPHIFHTNDEDVWNWINRFGKFNNYCHQPKAVYNGKMYSLPFNMNTFYEIYGQDIQVLQWIKESIQADCVKCDDIKTVEDYALHHVGRKIYEILIKEYTEKQWQKPCNELPASIIKRLPLRFTFDNRYFSDVYQGIPLDGYTKLVDNILNGIDVKLKVDYRADRGYYDSLANTVVYTGAIDEYFDYKLGMLQYRSLTFEHIQGEHRTAYCNAVTNFTSKETPYTRVTESGLFNPERNNPSNNNWLSWEKPVEWKLGNERYYPINTDDNQKIYNEYRDLAKTQPNVIFGGRLGTYRYYDMHQVIAMAMKDFERWQRSHQQN